MELKEKKEGDKFDMDNKTYTILGIRGDNYVCEYMTNNSINTVEIPILSLHYYD